MANPSLLNWNILLQREPMEDFTVQRRLREDC